MVSGPDPIGETGASANSPSRGSCPGMLRRTAARGLWMYCATGSADDLGSAPVIGHGDTVGERFGAVVNGVAGPPWGRAGRPPRRGLSRVLGRPEASAT